MSSDSRIPFTLTARRPRLLNHRRSIVGVEAPFAVSVSGGNASKRQTGKYRAVSEAESDPVVPSRVKRETLNGSVASRRLSRSLRFRDRCIELDARFAFHAHSGTHILSLTLSDSCHPPDPRIYLALLFMTFCFFVVFVHPVSRNYVRQLYQITCEMYLVLKIFVVGPNLSFASWKNTLFSFLRAVLNGATR